MSRIPEETIEHIKQRVSLVQLVESQGIELKKQGSDFIGRCPFHDDKTPSLVISPDKNLWHCLGACQMGGSVIDWVMKSQGVSFRHAVEILKADHSSLADEINPVKRTTVKKLPNDFAEEASDAQLLLRVINYYHETLKQSPEVLTYLASRGLNHPELIHHFKLGYANRSLGYRIPAKNRKEGQQMREQLQRIGILRSSGHEHFNGSIVVPIFDENGLVTEAYGRKIRDDLREGTAYHLYLPGPHRGIFNFQALKASQEIVLCEALIDAMTFWVAGFKNVTSSYGIEGFTPDHVQAFQTYKIKKVWIAYDRDEAGEKGAVKLSEKLFELGIECFRIYFPKDMDANSYMQQAKPEQLEILIRKAAWMGKGSSLVQIQEPPATITIEPPAAKEKETTIGAQINEHEIKIPLGDRSYRIRGLHKNMSYEQIKVNILVSLHGAFHFDTLDLYSSRQRSGYIKQASLELKVQEETIKSDLGHLLLKLEDLQDKQIRRALEPKKKEIQMTEAEKEQALILLKDPDLLKRILEDFTVCGVIGEECNKLVGYLACVSRKLEKPLAIVIQSSSAAGKSSLMDAVLVMMPPEEKVQYSAMTGQSLFYMGGQDLKHKILAIAEEEGAERASYALKLLQSDGELTIASTGKDASTGKLTTHEYRVEGPVMIFLTTTAIEVDEELLNRCIVMTVNESREQTQAIHRMQRTRQTLKGLLVGQERQEMINRHRNAQRLLRPLMVANPYAEELTFLNDRTRTRRDHMKYLALIQAITLLYQHQRPVKTIQHKGKSMEYIETTLDDIAIANELAHEVLGRTLDELPPQTRSLLLLIEEMVAQVCLTQNIKRSDYRFSRKDVRNYSSWGNTQLKIHLQRLEEMEYLLIHRGGRGQSIVYELLYDGKGSDGQPFLMGLIDLQKLGYDKKKSGVIEKKPAPSRGQVSGMSGLVGLEKTHLRASEESKNAVFEEKLEKNAYRGDQISESSYRTFPLAAQEVAAQGGVYA